MVQTPYNIGGEIAIVQAVPPQSVLVANSGVAINGVAIDRQAQTGGTGGSAGLAQSMKVGTHVGALSAGTPVVTSVVTKIQHSADGSTGWADYKPDGVNTAQSVAGNTALSSDSNLSVDLRMANRYVRAVTTPTFTGGASGIYLAVTAALGGYPNTPVTTPAA